MVDIVRNSGELGEGRLSQIGELVRSFETERAAIERQGDYTREAKGRKTGELESHFNAKIAAIAEPGVEYINDALKLLEQKELELMMSKTLEPADLAGWQLAELRAESVKTKIADFASRTPSRVLGLLELAVAKEDKGLAYLVKQFGPAALVAAGRNDLSEQLQARIMQLETADMSSLQADARRLSDLRSRLGADHLGTIRRNALEQKRREYSL